MCIRDRVEPIELLDILLSVEDEDIGYSLGRIINMLPQQKLLDGRLWEGLANASSKNDSGVVCNIISWILTRDSLFANSVIPVETIDLMNDTAANLLRGGEHIYGLLIAGKLDEAHRLDMGKFTSVLNSPEVWNGIMRRYNDLFRLDVPLNIIKEKLVLEGVDRLVNGIIAENDTSWQRSMVSFLCMDGFARREDYPKLLQLLKSLNDTSAKQQLIDLLLDLDFVRGSALFLTLAYSINDLYYLGDRVSEKNGISEKYAKQVDLASELISSYASVFNERIVPGDRAILLDPPEIVEGCFHTPQGDGPELYFILPELFISAPLLSYMVERSFEAIGKNALAGSVGHVEVLINLFEASSKNASRFGHNARWGDQIVKTIRRIDDGEWIGYWLVGKLKNDSATAVEALICMLDHDMDYLILEVMSSTMETENRLRRLPDEEGKYKRKIERILGKMK
jgi:hypothetical protein